MANRANYTSRDLVAALFLAALGLTWSDNIGTALMHMIASYMWCVISRA